MVILVLYFLVDILVQVLVVELAHLALFGGTANDFVHCHGYVLNSCSCPAVENQTFLGDPFLKASQYSSI